MGLIHLNHDAHVREDVHLHFTFILRRIFMKQLGAHISFLVVVALAGLAMMSAGCGTVEETTSEDWTSTPPISTTAQLEYRLDSLSNENRKLQQQLEVVATENTNLSARNSELETRMREAVITPRPAASAPPPSAPRSSAAFSGGYEAALSKYRNRNFQEAIDHFSSLVTGGISEDLLDNCYYWIGESYFGLKRYDEAIQQFQTVTGMAGSDKADDAQYMIGNSYLQAGNREQAREAFQKLLTLYPASQLAGRARSKMSSL